LLGRSADLAVDRGEELEPGFGQSLLPPVVGGHADPEPLGHRRGAEAELEPATAETVAQMPENGR
jgi:hypothetical protein